MSIPARTVTPEVLEEARRLYEHSRVPLLDIAAMLGICKSTLNNRVKQWGWTRRAARIPPAMSIPGRQPVPEAAAGPGASPPAAPPPVAGTPETRAELIARLVARVENEISQVERLVTKARLSAATDSVAEAERAARTLAVLVRSLRELDALKREADVPEDEDIDDGPRDADAYRRELAATLERVLAEGAAS